MSEVHRSLRVRYFQNSRGVVFEKQQSQKRHHFPKNQLSNKNLRKISEMGIEISKEQ